MNSKTQYNTKQREEIFKYLKTVPGVHITVADVCAYFRSIGAPIGQTTVYRHLERLVNEGVLQKYIIDGNSPACFEFKKLSAEEDSAACFHCKCEKCGRLVHLRCDELAIIETHLSASHRFTLNPLRTVLYGLCEDCRNAEKTHD